MFQRIFWINVGLFIITILLGVNVYRVWSTVAQEEWKLPLSMSTRPIRESDLNELKKKKRIEIEPLDTDDEPVPLYAYDIIADKNLFRPQRSQWLPPLPESEKKEKSVKPPELNRNRPSMKDPILCGIIIIGDKKRALMKGWRREEPKKQFRKIRLKNGGVRKIPLPPRQGKIVPSEVKGYHIGDVICESTLEDILPDRIILNKNGVRKKLLLRDPSRKDNQKSRRTASQGAASQGATSGQPSKYPRSPAYSPPKGVRQSGDMYPRRAPRPPARIPYPRFKGRSPVYKPSSRY